MLSFRMVPAWRKAGYGAAEAGITAAETMLQLYLLKFYTDTVGLRSDLVGLAVGIGIAYDAFADPYFGAVSDRTQTAMGRRRPFILIGAPLLAAALFLIFNPPLMESTLWKFIYLAGLYILLNTAMTIVSVPHISLGAEMVFDRNERTSVYAYRLLFANVGLLAGSVLPGIFQRMAKPEMMAAAVIGIMLLLTGPAAVLATKGLDRGECASAAKSGFIKGFAGILRGRVFLMLFAAFAVATVGRTFNASFALYYYEYRLQLTRSQITVEILGVFFLVFTISVPLWVLLSRRLGKKWPAFFGVLLLGIMTIVAYPIFPPGGMKGPLFAAVFGGALVGSILLLDSLLADVVDYDELKTGLRREGAYFGIWKMGTKLSRAVTLLASGFMLQSAGFVPNQPQTEQTSWTIALYFGPLVGSFFVIGAILFAFMPMTDEAHRRIQNILVRRRG